MVMITTSARRAIWFGNDPYITGTGPDVHTRMSKQMSVDRFEYPDLALTVERGKVGEPSTVTLDWVTVDDEGQEHDRKLVLGCELLIDKVERCRELTIVSVSGDADAVKDFNAYLPSDIEYQGQRIVDVADGLGRAILHDSIKEELPELVVKRCA